MVSGKVIALVALAISLVGLLLALPTKRRWQGLLRTSLVTGDQDLVAGADSSTRWTPSPRKALAFVASLLLVGAAALVLVGNIFWTEEVLRKPSSPLVHALLALVLALMMTGYAVVRFIVASASRRPRRQRAHGVLLLLLAGYLLVRAFWMM